MRIEEIEGLFEFLTKNRKIVITNHVNPDGDAMGSALAMQGFLSRCGHDCSVIVPNDYPDFLNWMEGSDNVLRYTSKSKEADAILSDSELVIVLDYNTLNRSGEMEDSLKNSKADFLMIDHHQMPDDFARWTISDTSKSSTAEMVYDFIESYGKLDLINLSIAECLYTGLVTDTGSFRFSSTSSRTHKIASFLLEVGVKPNLIYDRVYDDNSASRLYLLGRMLENMEIFSDKGVVLLKLTREDQEEFDYQRGDSEGFVNYGLSISGINCAIFIREDKERNKLSLRSKGELDVNKIAREYFNGGGHMNAAGGSLELTLENSIQRIKEVIEKEF